MSYESLSPKALKLMRLSSLLLMFFILILPSLVAIAVGKNTIPIAIPIAIIVLSIVYIFAVPLIRFRRYKYLIASDRIEIKEGILFIKRTIVPIDRIHQIDVLRGPIDNLFGVAKVNITTAGSIATFRFLELEKADEIAAYLNSNLNKKISKIEEVQNDV
ncbi:MAG TPA: PH domain-containing protein [Clostridia bacterium]|nr:PH domain-containing protein [Clostridia bacterium]